MTTRDNSSEYGAAVTPVRRWVVRSEQVDLEQLYSVWKIRCAYSDTANIWHELPHQGLDEFMCSAAPITDTTAMVVYSVGKGLRWAIATGHGWADSGTVDPRFGLHPRLTLRRDGGLWLLYTAGEFDYLGQTVFVSTYRNGAWAPYDSTISAPRPPGTFVQAWCGIEPDPEGAPAIAWGDLGYGYTYYDIGTVSFPSDTGYTAGEDVPGSRGIFDSPEIFRDLNGDLWAANDLKEYDSVTVVHTYVKATASTPSLGGTSSTRTLSWTLSEPAPGSWWAVLRSRDVGPFDAIARVRADSALSVSWSDSSPASGTLHYKIRRECVDVRYQWESRASGWPLRSEQPIRFALVPSPLSAADEIELSGAAAGPLEILLYDLQGRTLLRQHLDASGSGIDRFRIDPSATSSRLSSGVYFLRARDASGSVSEPSKVVYLR